MKHITFYLDFISPYAYLAFETLPQALEGLSYSVGYTPVLFAGLLKHHGQLGPAEISGKRQWTYRQVMWLARSHDVELKLPAAHPFNPLAHLRLAVACGPNRYNCEAIFRHVWRTGGDAGDGKCLETLRNLLQPDRDPSDPSVKDELKANTERAITLGLFGVPTFCVDDKLFWGLDALPMLRAYLTGDSWFDREWDAVAQLPENQRAR